MQKVLLSPKAFPRLGPIGILIGEHRVSIRITVSPNQDSIVDINPVSIIDAEGIVTQGFPWSGPIGILIGSIGFQSG